MAQNDVGSPERGASAGFAVEYSRHGDSAAGGDAAHVVEIWGGYGAGDFPFAGVLSQQGFHFFVDAELGQVGGADAADYGEVREGAGFPVFDEGGETEDPFIAGFLIACLWRKDVLALQKNNGGVKLPEVAKSTHC